VTKAPIGLGLAFILFGCSNQAPSPDDAGGGGAATGGASSTGGVSGTGGGSGTGPSGGAGTENGGTSGDAGSAGSSSGGAGGAGGAGGSAPMWGIETRPTGQTCLKPATQNGAAMLLSASGCVDPADPKRPAATLIPYDVSSALWSDAADKQRFFALPDGATIDVKDCTQNPASCAPVDMGGTYEDEGDWTFPIGTVFMKTFAFGEKLVETRLLVRAGEFDYWGYSYQWRDDQTDADLLASNVDGYDAGIEGPNGTQIWHFPSRTQCLQCHTTPAGVSLGPETSQLNADFAYPNGVTGNQLDTLEHIDVFTAALARRPAYPAPDDASADLAERARSYLQSNCAMCHRPGSNFASFDARFSIPFAEMNLCNAVPEKGDLGVAGALRIKPGDPASSLVSLRMHIRDPMTQMPQVGSNVVDSAGVGVIDQWITSLTGCP
jgi:uncharacterized repeat protein (TIGR03806 family)